MRPHQTQDAVQTTFLVTRVDQAKTETMTVQQIAHMFQYAELYVATTNIVARRSLERSRGKHIPWESSPRNNMCSYADHRTGTPHGYRGTMHHYYQLAATRNESRLSNATSYSRSY